MSSRKNCQRHIKFSSLTSEVARPLDVAQNEVFKHPLPTVTLKRYLTLLHSVSLIVGSIIGSGVFVSPDGVLQHAGSPLAALAVWAVSGVLCTIGALCFIELGAMFPESGGEYSYVWEAFGSLPAFVCLWVNVVLIRPAAQAVVSLACAEYTLAPFFSSCSPPRLPVCLLAAAALCLLTAINCQSAKAAMRVQTLFTGAKLFALVAIICCGLFYICTAGAFVFFLVMDRPAHFHRFLSNFILYSESFENGGYLANLAPHDLETGVVDIAGLPLAFYSGLFAYGGWNYLNIVTEEIKDPHRNLPRAIWLGLPLVTLIYVLVNVAYLAVLPQHVVAASRAVAVMFGRVIFGPLQYVVPVFVALSTFGSLNGILFTSGRLFYAGARRGHMPTVLSFIHVNSRTPTPALLVSCTLSLVLLPLDIFELIDCLSFVLWLSIGAATAALLYLRVKQPMKHRPIKVNITLPVLFLVCCIYLVLTPMFTSPRRTGLGVLITLTALPVFFFGSKMKTLHSVRAVERCLTAGIQKCFYVVCPEDSRELAQSSNNDCLRDG